jgi:hypothetical protein
MLRSKNKWIILGVLAVAATLGVGVAVATVTSTVLSDTHPAGGSANEIRLRIVRSEFVPSSDQPTFSSGWHTHPGPVIFQVQEAASGSPRGLPAARRLSDRVRRTSKRRNFRCSRLRSERASGRPRSSCPLTSLSCRRRATPARRTMRTTS